VVIKDDRVTGEEHLLTERGQRIRDVRQGPDGNLYVVTDDANGELLRISPRK
jgi:aldose sugar dehydrogenase